MPLSQLTTQSSRRSRWSFTLGVFLLLVAFTPGVLFNSDGWTNHGVARSLARGDSLAVGPDLDSELAPNGKWYSTFGAILPLLATPFIWLGFASDRLGATPFFVESRCVGDIFFGAMFNAAVSALIAWEVFRMLAKKSGRPRLAFATSLA